MFDKSLLTYCKCLNVVSYKNPYKLVSVSRYICDSTYFHVDTFLKSRYSQTYIFAKL